MRGAIHIKLLLALTLGLSTGVIWAVEAVVAQPETALERMFNSFMGTLPLILGAGASAWAIIQKVNANTKITKEVQHQTNSLMADLQAERRRDKADYALALATLQQKYDDALLETRTQLSEFQEKLLGQLPNAPPAATEKP